MHRLILKKMGSSLAQIPIQSLSILNKNII